MSLTVLQPLEDIIRQIKEFFYHYSFQAIDSVVILAIIVFVYYSGKIFLLRQEKLQQQSDFNTETEVSSNNIKVIVTDEHGKQIAKEDLKYFLNRDSTPE
ncbi:hypothetical protein [Spirosoma litoris]